MTGVCKLLLISLSGWLAFSAGVLGQSLALGDVLIATGSSGNIPFTFTNSLSQTVTGLQFDLTFDPSYLTSNTVVDGTPLGLHVQESRMLGNTTRRFIIYSINNTPIADGILLNLSFSVNENAPANTTVLTIENVVLSNATAGLVTPQNVVNGSITNMEVFSLGLISWPQLNVLNLAGIINLNPG